MLAVSRSKTDAQLPWTNFGPCIGVFAPGDQITRDRLNMELVRITEATEATVLFVTHSIREAVLLSDRVVVMSPRPGRIVSQIEIDLPRPRSLATREDPRYLELIRQGAVELEKGYDRLAG